MSDITLEHCDTKLSSLRLSSLVSQCSRVISDVSNKHILLSGKRCWRYFWCLILVSKPLKIWPSLTNLRQLRGRGVRTTLNETWFRLNETFGSPPPPCCLSPPPSTAGQVTSQDITSSPPCTAMVVAKYLGLFGQISGCFMRFKCSDREVLNHNTRQQNTLWKDSFLALRGHFCGTQNQHITNPC